MQNKVLSAQGSGMTSDRRGWRFDKTLGAGDIVAVILLAVPLFLWSGKVDTRALLAEERLSALERRISDEKMFRDTQRAEDRTALQQALGDLQGQMRAMEARQTDSVARLSDKLDKIADRVGASK